ncbi:MAG: hypothetical protein F6K28_27060 [Microcoleus sp. SIO2G3]|nr:hypothetical protein [Microcoleus sp. SIO2G3]
MDSKEALEFINSLFDEKTKPILTDTIGRNSEGARRRAPTGGNLARSPQDLTRHDVVQEYEGSWRIIVELFRRWVLQA